MNGDRYGKFPLAWVEDTRLTAPQLAVLAVLSVHADYDTGIAFPSHRRIAFLCGRTRGWASVQIRTLALLGLIEIDKSQHLHRYKIVDLAQSSEQVAQSANKVAQSANTNENKERKKKKKTVLISTTFQPTEEDISVIKDQYPHFNATHIKNETTRFIEYFTIGKGEGTKRSGWSASWRNWMRRSSTPRPNGRLDRQTTVTTQRQENIARVVRDIEARESAKLSRGS